MNSQPLAAPESERAERRRKRATENEEKIRGRVLTCVTSEAMCSCSPSLDDEDGFSKEGIPLLPASSPAMDAASTLVLLRRGMELLLRAVSED